MGKLGSKAEKHIPFELSDIQLIREYQNNLIMTLNLTLMPGDTAYRQTKARNGIAHEIKMCEIFIKESTLRIHAPTLSYKSAPTRLKYESQ